MKNIFTDIRDYLRAIDNENRLFIGTSLFFSILIYTYRAQSDEFWLMGLGAAFIIIIFFPFLLALLVWFLVHIFRILRHIFQVKKFKNIAGLSILLIALAFLLPVPLLREHSLYLSHQKEYMNLVHLVQSGQLLSNGQYKSCLTPPKEYQNLTGNCIRIKGKNIIEFEPYSYFATLSYAEVPSDIFTSSSCYKYGYIWKEINPNWYVCKRHYD